MTKEQLELVRIKSFHNEYTRNTPGREGQVNKVIIYECKCSTIACSNTFLVQKSQLKRSTGLCSSCAAQSKPHITSFNGLKRAVKYHGFKTIMSYEEYLEICKIPNCHYCDKPLNRVANRKGTTTVTSYMLDRMDNKISYLLNNCVPCCWPCNQLKGDLFTYGQFKKLRLFMKIDLSME